MADNPSNTRYGGQRQIPGYQLLEKLGSGAMAVVYKARQISLDRVVAIKILSSRLSKDEEYVKRFYAEGQIAAKLNHPNIVQSIDVGQAGEYYYFVMEYVEGKTVYEELAAGKKYAEAEALDIAIQMAKALQHAHEQGLIHRDVKPKNIMITPGGVAKLMDMGLARVADDAKAIESEAGRLFGTPYYISPEQILGRKDIDFRCDIYSLGATLYHMLTGRPPFQGKTSKEVMIKHIKKAPRSPDRYNMELSRGICAVVEKMLAKNPAHRQSSTKELVEELQSVEFLLDTSDSADTAAGIENIADNIRKIAEIADKKSSVHKPAPGKNSLKTPLKNEQPSVIRVAERNPLNKLLLAGFIASLILNLILLLLWLK